MKFIRYSVLFEMPGKSLHGFDRMQEAFARSVAAPAVLQKWSGMIRQVAESCRGEAVTADLVDAELERVDEARFDVLTQFLTGFRTAGR